MLVNLNLEKWNFAKLNMSALQCFAKLDNKNVGFCKPNMFRFAREHVTCYTQIGNVMTAYLGIFAGVADDYDNYRLIKTANGEGERTIPPSRSFFLSLMFEKKLKLLIHGEVFSEVVDDVFQPLVWTEQKAI